MTKIAINKEIFDRIEPLNIGVIICHDVRNTYDGNEIQGEYDAVSAVVKAKFEGVTELAEYPVIRRWRDIYKSFGEKKSRSSVESLIRRVVNGKVIPSINPLVDLYNIASLKFEMPSGGEDLGVISGDIELTFADGTEEFISLGETEIENPNPGEIIYRFGKTVICRNFNYRESDITKLTEDTRDAIIVFEDVNDVDIDSLQSALDYLSNFLEKYLCAQTSNFILSKDNPEAEITQ